MITMTSKTSTPMQQSKERVIAVDPGYERCGVAVLERQDGKEVLIHSECIVTPKSLPFPERLRMLGERFKSIIERTTPTTFAMETLYFSKNQKTAIAVAEARGVITFIAAVASLPLYEYGPGAVKIAITGSGNADKKQVMVMIPRLIRLTKTIELDDEYDAIAIGLTHLATNRE